MLLDERHAATHDFLTGLYNREYFYKQAERCLKLHPDEHYLMVCSDVRNFKMINDVFGTKAADQLLIDIANAIRTQTISGEIYGQRSVRIADAEKGLPRDEVCGKDIGSHEDRK